MSDEQAEQVIALLASIAESLRILVDAVERERAKSEAWPP